MQRDNAPWRAVEAAEVDWDASDTPQSRRFGDVYYSRDDGLAEGRHVFLEGNGLPRRWQDAGPGPFTVFETGFGTGLNFLLTWQAWRHTAPAGTRLHYVSVEKYPMTDTDLGRALAHWPSLDELTQALLGAYPGLLPGQHRLLFDGGRVCLDLWWEDVAVVLPDLAGRDIALVDAWYLDGFAPSRNGAMWHESLFPAMARMSREGATVSTFTAAGAVRRGLDAAGFSMHKVPGFGRKRESLRGRLQRAAATAPAPAITPWDLVETEPPVAQSVIILGGGLAGCHTAAALARRGLAVTLLESGHVAGAGSGNEQGLLFTRLSRRHSALTDFALLSYRFASQCYAQMLGQGVLREGIDGSLCGNLQQAPASRERDLLRQALTGVERLARVVDDTEAAALLGIAQCEGGYWFPRSGWLHPPTLCRALLDHPRITVREHCGTPAIEPGQGGWQATGLDGEHFSADALVIACGTGCQRLPGCDWLPLRAIRGQTTHLASAPPLSELRAALCHDGYIAPARQGQHCIGATFDLDDHDTHLRVADHRRNLDALAAAVPAWRQALAALDPAQLPGRVGFRCTTPDYLPMIGPLPDRDAFLDSFGDLRRNARRVIARRAPCLPGLYLNTGHGSRGLTSTPLAAELLASEICREAPPVSRELRRALNPARFLVRDLGRNRL